MLLLSSYLRPCAIELMEESKREELGTKDFYTPAGEGASLCVLRRLMCLRPGWIGLWTTLSGGRAKGGKGGKGAELDDVFLNSKWVLIGENSIPYQYGHQTEMQQSAMIGARQIFVKLFSSDSAVLHLILIRPESLKDAYTTSCINNNWKYRVESIWSLSPVFSQLV